MQLSSSDIWGSSQSVNEELKRPSSMVGIFPSSAAVRLTGASLIDMRDEWIARDRRFLSESSMAKLYEASDNKDVAAIEGGSE